MAKVGLSFSRCVLDIVEGRVDIDDVLVVIARTDFDPHDDTQWSGIWLGYGGGGYETDTSNAGLRMAFSGSNPEWAGYTDKDEDKFRTVAMQLWDDGKFHQPRKFGAYPQRRPEFWLETCLPSSELDRNPAAKKAWDQFQVIAGLTAVKLDKTYK